MADFKFTGTQGQIKTSPFQNRVEPPTQISRTMESLNQLAGSYFQYEKVSSAVEEEQKQEEFKLRAIAQKNAINQAEVDWNEASYEERAWLLEDFQATQVDIFQGNDEYTEELRSRAIQAQSSFQNLYNQEALDIEHSNAVTDQNLLVSKAIEDYNNTGDIRERRKVLTNLEKEIVAPYAERTDVNSIDLYNKGLKAVSTLKGELTTYRKTLADNKISTDAIAAVQAEIQLNGKISAERYTEISKGLERRSDYALNKAKLHTELDSLYLKGMQSVLRNPNIKKDMETYNQFKANLDEFEKIAPRIVGKSYHSEALIFASSLYASASNLEESNLNDMVGDPSVGASEVSSMASKLVEQNIISKEKASFLNEKKKTALKTQKIKPQVVEALQSLDKGKLQELILNGHGGVINTQAKGNVDVMYANIVSEMDARPDDGQPKESSVVIASREVLSQYKKYKDIGVSVKLDAVNSILRAPNSGTVLTEDQFNNFLAVKEMADEIGYTPPNPTTVSKNYAVIKGLENMGIPDAYERFNTAKLSPSSVSDKNIDKVLNKGFSMTDFFTENLDPRNAGMLTNSFRPAVKALLQAGVSEEEAQNRLEALVKESYIEVDPKFGGGSELLIPKTEELGTNDDYQRAFDAFNIEAAKDGNSLVFLSPVDLTAPEGEWMWIDSNGIMNRNVKYDDIKEAAKYGRLR